MEVSPIKASQLPLDFSLNVKTEGITNLNIHVKASESSANMLISPDKGSQSAFKVVTPKHADGKPIRKQSLARFVLHLFSRVSLEESRRNFIPQILFKAYEHFSLEIFTMPFCSFADFYSTTTIYPE